MLRFQHQILCIQKCYNFNFCLKLQMTHSYSSTTTNTANKFFFFQSKPFIPSFEQLVDNLPAASPSLRQDTCPPSGSFQIPWPFRSILPSAVPRTFGLGPGLGCYIPSPNNFSIASRGKLPYCNDGKSPPLEEGQKEGKEEPRGQRQRHLLCSVSAMVMVTIVCGSIYRSQHSRRAPGRNACSSLPSSARRVIFEYRSKFVMISESGAPAPMMPVGRWMQAGISNCSAAFSSMRSLAHLVA